MAKILPATKEGIDEAGKQLRKGNLVAFPTETVYGLGANALNEQAVLNIFKCKGRPLTDPLIVHVPSVESALELIELNEIGRQMFEYLTGNFWPGPLTLISKARSILPSCITAETGFVGLRYPSLPLAQALLHAAQVPVAAPSANRFGHVSPTSAAHVYKDLGTSQISILNTTADSSTVFNALENSTSCSSVCQVGIESTVVKIVPEEKKLIIFRRGGVSQQSLQQTLNNVTIEALKGWTIQTPDMKYSKTDSNHDAPSTSSTTTTSTSNPHVVEENVHAQAPGQLLTHYAPDIETFLLSINGPFVNDSSAENSLNSTVLIDFAGKLKHLQLDALAYRDLSISGNIAEAATNIFDTLRWTESVEGAKRVLLMDLSTVSHEHTAAVHDRMFRAASGKLLPIDRYLKV